MQEDVLDSTNKPLRKSIDKLTAAQRDFKSHDVARISIDLNSVSMHTKVG